MSWIESALREPPAPGLTAMADRADEAAERLRARRLELSPESPVDELRLVRFEVTVRLPPVVLSAVDLATNVVRWLLRGARP